ncbi:MAG: FHA domain-containing protein [Planctomycetota bacterium]
MATNGLEAWLESADGQVGVSSEFAGDTVTIQAPSSYGGKLDLVVLLPSSPGWVLRTSVLLDEATPTAINVEYNQHVAGSIIGGLQGDTIDLGGLASPGWVPVTLATRPRKRLLNLPPHQRLEDPNAAHAGRRLTLSVPAGDARRSQHYNLIGGDRLHFGRANTTKPDDPEIVPNDVVLRAVGPSSLSKDIGRWHGRLAFHDEGFYLQHVGARFGSVVDQLGVDGDFRKPLLRNRRVVYHPGTTSVNSELARRLPLPVVPCAAEAADAALSAAAEGYGLPQPARQVGPFSSLRMERGDALADWESYTLIQSVAKVGADDACAIRIEGRGAADVEARIYWFAGAFWIEAAANRQVIVNGQQHGHDRLHRLVADDAFEIGGTAFSVKPWQQHLLT